MNSVASSEDMCRACMRADGILVPMYDGQLGGKKLPVKLAELTGVQINKFDGLPSKLCIKCAYRTLAFYDFKMQVQCTEKKLRKTLELDCSWIKVEVRSSNDEQLLQVESSETLKSNAAAKSIDEEKLHVNHVRDLSDEDTASENEADLGHDGSNDNLDDQSEAHEFEGDVSLLNPKVELANDEEEGSKLHDAEYTLVYTPTDSAISTLPSSDSCMVVNPVHQKAPSNNSLPQPQKSCSEQTSVFYKSKTTPINFIIGKLVDGEDSESDDVPKARDVMAMGVASDAEDSDYFVDSKDNVLGSLNDTIVRIKEIKDTNNTVNYQCTLCMQNYRQLTGVLNHIVNNHVPATGPFFCTVCEKDCDSRRELRSHVKLHTGPLPYVCFICGKAYSVKRYLRRHMVSHTDFFRHRCPKCGQRFKTKSELETHVTSHIHGSPYACSQCPRVFNHKGNYKRHLITHLDPHGLHLPKFPCNICGKRFLNNRTLETHIRVHTGEKPFKCNICNKSFSQQGNLLNHMRIHSNPRSYTCEVCGKQFNQRSTLKDHSLLHTGEKPHVCTVCGIAFTFSSALRRHMWTHAGGKPYGCDICDARFVGQYDLKRHMSIHSDRPRLKKRRTQKKEEESNFVQLKEDISTRDGMPVTTETILIEHVLLGQDMAQVVRREECEKENVDALFTLIQYGE